MNNEELDLQSEDEIEVEAIGVEVDSQPIELYKVLKIADAVSGGGEAKYAITEGYVAVNGELETRKRRKLYDGDLIEFNQEYYLLICDAPVVEKSEKEIKPAAKKQVPNKDTSLARNKKSTKATDKKIPTEHKPKQTETPVKEENTTGGRGAIKFF